MESPDLPRTCLDSTAALKENKFQKLLKSYHYMNTRQQGTQP